MGRLCYFCRVNIHEKYLLRCLEIAKNALGTAAPNPMVGAVLVEGDSIIGEGYTSPFGGPHAEVNAIRSVKDPQRLKRATLYVSLEPCCHHGKTPPCTDLILEKGIPRVVIGLRDPHEKVAGQGIRQLREGGCEVLSGVLEAACRVHHRRFLSFHEKKRPYVILKWAQSPDGFIAPEAGLRSKNPEPFWISGPLARQWVHKWRAEEQAILVGARTALEDNPALNLRFWSGNPPLRMVADPDLSVPESYRLLDGSTPTIVFHEETKEGKHIPGVTYEVLDFDAPLAEQVVACAHSLDILSILIEGGAQTLQSFLDSGLWDEARVFTGEKPIKKGLKAPDITGEIRSRKQIGPDLLTCWSHD